MSHRARRHAGQVTVGVASRMRSRCRRASSPVHACVVRQPDWLETVQLIRGTTALTPPWARWRLGRRRSRRRPPPFAPPRSAADAGRQVRPSCQEFRHPCRYPADQRQREACALVAPRRTDPVAPAIRRPWWAAGTRWATRFDGTSPSLRGQKDQVGRCLVTPRRAPLRNPDNDLRTGDSGFRPLQPSGAVFGPLQGARAAPTQHVVIRPCIAPAYEESQE